MPIDFSTMSPEDVMLLQSTDLLPELGTLSTTEDGLLQFDSNVGFPTPERPSLFGRILATIAEPGNYIGNRAVSGLHQLGSALYNASTGSSASDIVSRLNEIDAQRQAEDQRRRDYIMGEPGSSLTPVDHAFNTIGVIIPAASSAKNLVRGLTRKALASRAAGDAIKAGQAAQTIGRTSQTIDNMTPFAQGTNFTNKDAMRFLQAAENPNGVRSAVADIVRNDNLLRSSINTSNSVDDTVEMFARAGRLDPETYVTLNNMKSGADIAGDISIARQPTLRANLDSVINKAARNKIIEAEELARAAGENLPRAWQGMSRSELVDIARDNTIREAWLNRLARQDIRNTLPNFGRTSVKTQLLGGLSNALGGVMSDLPYNPEAEARLAEVASSEPTSLKPTGTDKSVPATTATSTDDANTDDMMYESMAGKPDLYASNPTDVVSDGLSYNDDGTIPIRPRFEEYEKTLKQNTEDTNKYREGLKKDYENLRNIQAIDPYQWETRVQLERQLLDAEKRASNNYRDDPWNTIGAILTAPLTARRLQNPFEVWESSVQAAVDRDPEVRRLRRLLGYTNDLPSGSDRAKSEQSVIEQVSKVNLGLLDAAVKEQQKLIEAAMAFNSDVSKRRREKAEEEYKRAQTELARAKAKYYNNGGNRGFDPTVTSFLLNQGAGASPFKENN